jgi:S1-C subfamily serine protease
VAGVTLLARRAPSGLLAVVLVIATAAGCGGGHHPGHSAPLPAGPQEMTATVDAVRVAVDGTCGHGLTGGGLTDGHFVLTTATLVAGARAVQVSNAHGKQVTGRVVTLDADNDVAWVYAPGLPSTSIGPARESDRVVPAYVFGFTADGAPVTYRAQTLERTTVTGHDVFGEHVVARAIYRLHLDTPASTTVTGAPVLDSSGNLLGVVIGLHDRDARTVDVVAGDVVARSAATRELSGQDPATMAASAGTRCPVAVSSSS